MLGTREDSASSGKHSESCDGLGAALDGFSGLLLLLMLPPLHDSVEPASPLNVARRLHCTADAGVVSASRRAALAGRGGGLLSCEEDCERIEEGSELIYEAQRTLARCPAQARSSQARSDVAVRSRSLARLLILDDSNVTREELHS